jgi:hypothetical protein
MFPISCDFHSLHDVFRFEEEPTRSEDSVLLHSIGCSTTRSYDLINSQCLRRSSHFQEASQTWVTHGWCHGLLIKCVWNQKYAECHLRPMIFDTRYLQKPRMSRLWHVSGLSLAKLEFWTKPFSVYLLSPVSIIFSLLGIISPSVEHNHITTGQNIAGMRPRPTFSFHRRTILAYDSDLRHETRESIRLSSDISLDCKADMMGRPLPADSGCPPQSIQHLQLPSRNQH